MFLDDVLVYKGSLKASPHKDAFSVSRRKRSNSGSQPPEDSLAGNGDDDDGFWWVDNDLIGSGRGGGWMDLSQSILFSNNPIIVDREVRRHCFFLNTFSYLVVVPP